MSQNTKKESYKKYLKLSEQLGKVLDAQRNLGYVELETPIHHGYLGFFNLREDIARRDDGDALAELLSEYSTIVWSRTKDFIEGKKKRSTRIEPKLRVLEEYEYFKLPIKTQERFRQTWIKGWNEYRKGYVLDFPSHYLVIKKKKDYITHRKVIDGVLEAEERFIRDQISKIIYISSPYKESSMKPYSKIKNKGERRTTHAKMKNIMIQYDESIDSGELENTLTYKHRNSAKWERW